MTSYSRAGVHRWLTVISFCVSVPVLSVQMTLVEPSASTDESDFTRALRLLMRCTAMAKDSVTVGSSPSGMNATTMPSAKMNDAAIPLWTNITSSRKNATPMHSANTVICFVRWSSCLCSGLSFCSMFCVRLAILPNSVAMPVWVTTTRPLPSDTDVPSNTRFGISAFVRFSSSTASAVLRTGFDSPVSVDWSTCRSLERTTRPSAGTLSPSSSVSTSPGTRSSARTFCSCPSRMTFT